MLLKVAQVSLIKVTMLSIIDSSKVTDLFLKSHFSFIIVDAFAEERFHISACVRSMH